MNEMRMLMETDEKLVACREETRKLRKLLARVEWVDAGGDLYCHFCGASRFGAGHRDGCEWVEAIGGANA